MIKKNLILRTLRAGRFDPGDKKWLFKKKWYPKRVLTLGKNCFWKLYFHKILIKCDKAKTNLINDSNLHYNIYSENTLSQLK